MATLPGTTEVSSAYRDRIRQSLHDWPEFSWLDRFLQTPMPVGAAKSTVHILDIVGGRVRTREVEDDLSKLRSYE